MIFNRPDLARGLAERLLKPGVLDTGMRSGLFLSGIRRTGKTTFLQRDLIPALENLGALVVYVDLWSDVRGNPAELIREEIRRTLEALRTPSSALLQRLSRVGGLSIGAAGLSFGFDIEEVGKKDGPTLARAFTELVDRSGANVVLIIDEVQQATTTEEGRALLLALKSARDAVNARSGTAGYFLLVGTGSHRSLLGELTTRRSQAFAGATSIDYPVLGDDYVDWLLALLDDEKEGGTPSPGIARAAFRTVGHRPEELIRALSLLRATVSEGDDPDDHLPVIAATLRAAAADVELARIEQLGPLARAVFGYVAEADGDARGVFSEAAAERFSTESGLSVRVEDVQPVVNELLAANLVMRRGHGLYGVTDPVVQEMWLERRALLGR